MAKVIFSIQYEIIPEKRDEYLDVIRELKNLVKSEGLESYSVFEKNLKKITLKKFIYSAVKMPMKHMMITVMRELNF